MADYGSLLSSNGYVIRAVSNGADLFESIKHGAVPDLIVVDANLDNPPAFETVKVIKSQPSYSSIPILLLASPHGTQIWKMFKAWDRQTFKEVTTRQALNQLRFSLLQKPK